VISDAELKRTAAAWGTDPMIVDLDYSLGVFLSQWYRDDMAARLRFKGGTCLRKCYFPGYRFSEDLDFTLEENINMKGIEALLEHTISRVEDGFGLNMNAQQRQIRITHDQQGGSTIKVRLYYRGPLRRTGAPQSIRLHMTTADSEYLANSVNQREIIHPYSDQSLISGIYMRCYTLEEILSEKLRAICGQRRFAISRDIFDVHQILTRSSVEIQDALGLIKPKFEAKSLSLSKLSPEDFSKRRDEFEHDWNRSLRYLLPPSDKIAFGDAWNTVMDAVDWMGSID
jgi:predicted nucleotidyltransferase component of viral defense system